jgi:hypothetical protein
MRRVIALPLSRRELLAAAAQAISAAAVSAGSGNWLRDRHARQAQKQLNRYRGQADGFGYLDRPAFTLDAAYRPPQTPYTPQTGDVMFSETVGFIYSAGHQLSGAGQPSHTAFLFRRPDGTIALIEAGPFDVATIRALDLIEHLAAYDNRSRVWIRPRCGPLTSEQDCRLTEFCLKQDGKRFSRLRLYGQITPLKSRGKIKSEFVGGPHGPDRRSYFCAEMTAEAFVYAGLIPADKTRPPATYPSDLFFDESKIPFLNRNFKLGWYGWGAPSRWRPCCES